MRAAVRDRFGPPDVIEIRDVEKPAAADDEVLVRVRAVSLNRADWYELTGVPYAGRLTGMGLRRPKSDRLGVDFAGIAEAVGKEVTHVQPGDEVFGARTGSLAEYVNVRNAVLPKPANVTFEQAACVGIAGVTALQALRDKGRVQPGQKVLINGAAGGVGTFAVQIAKALGAEVTGVCSTRNVELVRSLGADGVVDYTQEDFTQSERRYDLLVDVHGGRPWSHLKRVLVPEATVVVAGAPLGSGLLGPMKDVAKLKLASLPGSRKTVFFIAKITREDVDVLRGMMEEGKVTPAVERTYTLDDVVEAFRYLGTGHVRSKLVVTP